MSWRARRRPKHADDHADRQVSHERQLGQAGDHAPGVTHAYDRDPSSGFCRMALHSTHSSDGAGKHVRCVVRRSCEADRAASDAPPSAHDSALMMRSDEVLTISPCTLVSQVVSSTSACETANESACRRIVLGLSGSPPVSSSVWIDCGVGG